MTQLFSSQAAMIGWRERVSLPSLSELPITAKVDTGARTSSLHAASLVVAERSGQPMASFEFHPDPEQPGDPTSVVAPVIEFRMVRSSNGQEQTRPVIRTELILAGERFEIELTLTCRERMGFRMLLGRRFLEDRFMVDPGRSFLLTEAPVWSMDP